MAHTPGHWHTEEGMDDDWWTDIKAGTETVAMCRGLDARKRNDNARLIAAAPELMEVLKAAIHDGRLQTFEDRDRFRQAAKKAIAKAEGVK